jgi:hypothetical protein
MDNTITIPVQEIESFLQENYQRFVKYNHLQTVKLERACVYIITEKLGKIYSQLDIISQFEIDVHIINEVKKWINQTCINLLPKNE